MSATTRNVRLKSFQNDQRVKVVDAVTRADHSLCTINAFGTVRRVRTDGGAWVALDERSKVEAINAFPVDDDRASHVLAYPEDCEAATETRAAGSRKERRSGQKVAEKAVADEKVIVTLATFGSDHWSTFGYIETRCVDYRGVPDKRHMRCHHGRHVWHAHEGGDGSEHPTRLKGGLVVQNHDDWDCLDDLELVGFIVNVGTTVNPVFQMTERGREVAKRLRAHKANGGSWDTFEPESSR